MIPFNADALLEFHDESIEDMNPNYFDLDKEEEETTMRPIDADKLHYHKIWIEKDQNFAVVVFAKEIDHAKTIDAVPIADVEAWLLEIAFNCVGVQDDMAACAEDLANRMEGLRKFSEDRRRDEA